MDVLVLLFLMSVEVLFVVEEFVSVLTYCLLRFWIILNFYSRRAERSRSVEKNRKFPKRMSGNTLDYGLDLGKKILKYVQSIIFTIDYSYSRLF